MIPNEAMQAATNAYLRSKSESQGEIGWSALALRAALEAAAPHIRAQALEDAADDTADDELGYPTVELWLRALATNERSSL